MNISAENEVKISSLEEDRTTFATSVKLLEHSETSSNGDAKLKFGFQAVPTLASFLQKTAWRFRVKAHQGYILEVARYDDFGRNRSKTPTPTTWGASLHHTNWDAVLAENASLRIGSRADWNAAVENFFPPKDGHLEENDGFCEYVTMVQSIVDFMNISQRLFV